MYDDDIGIWARELFPKGFKPSVFYNKDGDMLEIHWESEDFRGEPLGEITLMLTRDDCRAVGVQVNCLKRVLREAGYELVPIKEDHNG